MHEVALLRDLALVMVLGGAVTALFHRIGQPVILGYILVGILVGPYATPFALVRDHESISTLAELGVILLLFSIGLEFNLRRLRRVGGVALVATALEMPLVIWLGYSIARVAGWETTDGVFLGVILSISSTTIILKTLMDLGQTREEASSILTGILILQDVAVVLVLVLLTGIATAGTVSFIDLGRALGGVGLFVVAVTVVGLLTVPPMIRSIARLPSREVLTVSVLGLCFGVAILAGELGFPVALGAFLIGAVVAETREARRIGSQIEPIRDMFSAMFFVAVGLSIDPSAIVEHAAIVFVLSAVSISAKLMSASFGTLIAGYPPRTALRVGLGLAPIGEFSFVIANLGITVGVLSEHVYAVIVGVAAVTILVTPWLARASDPITRSGEAFTPRAVRSFLDLYGHRLRRVRRPSLPEAVRWSAVRFILAGLLLIALLLITRALAESLRTELGTGSLVTLGNVVVWSMAGVVSIPAFIGFWRGASGMAVALSEWLAGGSRIVSETFRFVATVTWGLIFLAIAAPLFPTGVALAVTSVLVSIAVFIFWRSLHSIHEEAVRVLGSVFTDEAGENETPREELKELLKRNYPFEVVIEDFILPFTECGLNRLIGELEVRSKTGATIAGIYRDERVIMNPEPDVQLVPGDVLLLLGSREQVERATRLLESCVAVVQPR